MKRSYEISIPANVIDGGISRRSFLAWFGVGAVALVLALPVKDSNQALAEAKNTGRELDSRVQRLDAELAEKRRKELNREGVTHERRRELVLEEQANLRRYEADNNNFDRIRAVEKRVNPQGYSREKALENPGKYNPNEPDTLSLARLIYAETRSEWEKHPEILYHKGSSVLNRAKKRKQTIKDSVFEQEQYKAVRDGNSEYFHNPFRFIEQSMADKKAWETCYKVAEELIKSGPKYKTEYAVHQKTGEADPSNKYGWVKRGLQSGEFKEITKIPSSTRGTYHFYG